MQGVLLRRTKQTEIDKQVIVNLPDCVHTNDVIELGPEERKFYDDLKQQNKDVKESLQNEERGCAQLVSC